KLMLAKLTITIGPTLQAICATYLMASLVFYRKGISYHFVNIPAIAYIGILSYSLYVWQQLFLLGFPANSSWAFTFPINIVLIFAISAASYYLLEYPLLALRRRLHEPVSQGRSLDNRDESRCADEITNPTIIQASPSGLA